MAGDGRGRAAILTGERGVGKTTLCLELAESHPELSGLVSPAILDGLGRKVGFSCLCLHSGERWDLGRSDVRLDGPTYGRYSFSAEGIRRGVECVRAALGQPRRVGQVHRIVVLDEIGPLEMEMGEGFSTVFPQLAAGCDLLLVTRPGYVARLSALIPSHVIREFVLARDEPGLTAQRLLAHFDRSVLHSDG